MKRVISLVIAFAMFGTLFVMPLNNNAVVYADETDIQAMEELEEKSIADATVVLSKTSLTYTGKEQKPAVSSVKYGAVNLVKDIDYTVTYSNNIKAGTATVKLTGIGEYTGAKSVNFVINKASIAKATVSLPYSNYYYINNYQIPEPTVKFSGKTLIKNVDYKLTYANNKYPGNATIKVSGIGNYTSSVSKSFYIARTSGLKVKEYGTTWLNLKWYKQRNVSGYQLYKYNFITNKWERIKTINGNSTFSYKVTGLPAGYGYKFKIRSFVKANGKTYYGSYSDVLAAPTRPSKGVVTSLNTTVRLDLTAKWEKRACTGYQVYLSRYSDFSSGSKFTVKSDDTLSKKLYNLADGKTYYVKVRAYRVYGGKTVYGPWSSYKKIKTDGTGWVTISGKKYYYDNGEPLKGSYKLGGNKYYFSTINGQLNGASYTMWSKVKDQTSGTKWLFAVSRELNRVCVYYSPSGGVKDDWVLKYYWKCTTGAKSTKTPAGTFTVPSTKTHLRYFGEGLGYTCWYATRITGRVYFHSVLYNTDSKTSIQDGRLGYNLSHGCIRLAKVNALWIYNNIDKGTKVIIY